MVTENVACKDCLHYHHPSREVPEECRHPVAKVFDVVDGYRAASPRAMRAGGYACGLMAKLFEPRPTPTWWQRNGFGLCVAAILTAFVWTTFVSPEFRDAFRAQIRSAP